MTRQPSVEELEAMQAEALQQEMERYAERADTRLVTVGSKTIGEIPREWKVQAVYIGGKKFEAEVYIQPPVDETSTWTLESNSAAGLRMEALKLLEERNAVVRALAAEAMKIAAQQTEQ